MAGAPCDPSDLVYYRQRIGGDGVQRILQVTVQLHGPATQEMEVDGPEVPLPGRPKPGQSKPATARMRMRFRRQAAIEPVISHFKHQ